MPDSAILLPRATARTPRRARTGSGIELSVVIPCLNEAETVGACVEKACRAIREHGIAGEVILADNGSTDGSQEIAERLGARVVRVAERGYGAALMGGIAAAQGKYILMGDADDSYDFLELPRFLARLRQGYELVQGCRLESGGGRVMPGAMPVLHRWWGNPMFSALARWWFRAPIHDVYCGMRGFSRELYDALEQRCTGMEFASEMIIKASLREARIAEVPITLYPDGRRTRRPHLRTFRDGWRTLRFLLLYSPRWLFLMPGLLLIAAGALGYGFGMLRVRLGPATFDVHTILVASLAAICGYQSVIFAAMTKIFAISEGLLPLDRRMDRLLHVFNLERGLLGGAAAIAVGLALILVVVHRWVSLDFGALDYAATLRWVIPGVMLVVLGVQTILSSFFCSILLLRRG
ncbi:MAG TPA: glycosyltransferase family 2 protein [Gemmatimonadales bacterium]|nr:glycosyltransferase family 2 protein [Gemmatimonadales bacterium]